MKVHVAYTTEVDDEDREFINRRYGRPGLATREQVRDFFRDFGEVNGRGVISYDICQAELAALEEAERKAEQCD